MNGFVHIFLFLDRIYWIFYSLFPGIDEDKEIILIIRFILSDKN
jgi:hypothetical protein